MIDELSRRLALCLPNRLENAGLGDTAEIVVDRGLPAGLDHVEPDGAGQHISLVEPSLHAVGGNTAFIVAVGRLVDGESVAKLLRSGRTNFLTVTEAFD